MKKRLEDGINEKKAKLAQLETEKAKLEASIAKYEAMLGQGNDDKVLSIIEKHISRLEELDGKGVLFETERAGLEKELLELIKAPRTSFSKADADTVSKLGIMIPKEDALGLDQAVAANKKTPTEHFKDFMALVDKYLGLEKEAAKRVIIDLFLLEAARDNVCQLWCKVYKENDVVYGYIDYVLLKQQLLTQNVPKDIPYLIIAEAKDDLGDRKYLYQLISEMSACSEGNAHEVYGILTNGLEWIFCRLDTQNKFSKSKKYLKESQTEQVLSILNYLIRL